jgi:hypothetical protein
MSSLLVDHLLTYPTISCLRQLSFEGLRGVGWSRYESLPLGMPGAESEQRVVGSVRFVARETEGVELTNTQHTTYVKHSLNQHGSCGS